MNMSNGKVFLGVPLSPTLPKEYAKALLEKGLRAHTCIVGQSGCGKTTLISRYIEELILNGLGSVLIFDFNNDYRHFDNVDETNWEKDNAAERIINGYGGDEIENFKKRWGLLSKDIEVLDRDKYHVIFEDITATELQYLFDIRPNTSPGACWLSELLVEDDDFKKVRRSKDRTRKLPKVFIRWAEDRVKASEMTDYGDLPNEVERLADKLDLIKFKKGVKGITERGSFLIAFGKSPKGSRNIEDVLQLILKPSTAVVLELLKFDYEEYLLRNFVVLHTVRRVWAAVVNRFRNAEGVGGRELKPVFIVVDEAHNLIPSSADDNGGVVTLFKTIAAEGRKFGLFLILGSQRPEKIHPHIISECDNFVLMKSRPASVEYLKKDLPPIKGIETEIQKLRIGEAYLLGNFTDSKPYKIRSGIRRTQGV